MLLADLLIVPTAGGGGEESEKRGGLRQRLHSHSGRKKGKNICGGGAPQNKP